MLPITLPAEGNPFAIRAESVVVAAFAVGTTETAVPVESRHYLEALLAAVHLADRLSYPTYPGNDLDS